MNTDQVILHHYPQSPVSEKVRVVLGMKGVAWSSVEIPRLPPKPNLMPLTGGYRLTPTLQIGADIYCDTNCIIRELEHRFPSPSLFPDGNEGLAWAIGQWTDGPLFKDVVTVALVEMSPNMPPEFLADRGPLYFGADFSLDDIKAKYDACLANVRTQFGWMNAALSDKDFMMGSMPGLVDALSYYLVWFLRDRMAEGEAFLQQFDNLVKWENRIKNIGHGEVHEMDDLQALEIAKQAEPQTPQDHDPGDPTDYRLGDTVTVQPSAGGPLVTGRLHRLSTDCITLWRDDPQVANICTHFPRLGYRMQHVPSPVQTEHDVSELGM